MHMYPKNFEKVDRKVVKGVLIYYENDDGYCIRCEESKRLVDSSNEN